MCDRQCEMCMEPCDEGDEPAYEPLPSKRTVKGHQVDDDGFEMEEYTMCGLM